MTPLEQLLFNALQSASAALTQLDPSGENHDTEIIDLAMQRYRIDNAKERPALKVVEMQQLDPVSRSILRVQEALKIEGLTQAQRIAVLHLELDTVTREVQAQRGM